MCARVRVWVCVRVVVVARLYIACVCAFAYWVRTDTRAGVILCVQAGLHDAHACVTVCCVCVLFHIERADTRACVILRKHGR